MIPDYLNWTVERIRFNNSYDLLLSLIHIEIFRDFMLTEKIKNDRSAVISKIFFSDNLFRIIRTVSKNYRTRETRHKKNLEHIFKNGFLPHICGLPLGPTTFFGFWTRLFWRFLSFKPRICCECGSIGNFRIPRFNFCTVSRDWIDWTCLGAI